MKFLAYASIYLIWGSTYYAIMVGIETMGPSLMLGLRFLGGAACTFLLAGILEGKVKKDLTLKTVSNASLVGVLLLAGGTGMVGYAERTVPSHLAAVIVASMPLWIACWDAMWSKKWILKGSRAAGLGLGVAGVALLMWGGGGEWSSASGWSGILLMSVALVCWSFGASYSHFHLLPSAPLTSAAIQMAVGGVVALGWGWWMGEVRWEALWTASTRSWWAVGYLAVFGSTIAFTAFAWLLRVEPPSRVACYAFINPAIAILIGVGMGHEAVRGATWAGLGGVLAGLWLYMQFPLPCRKEAS